MPRIRLRSNAFVAAVILAAAITAANAQFVQQGPKLGGGGALGYSVALSADGNTAIAGAPKDGSVGASFGPGAAYVGIRVNGVWTGQARLFGTDATGAAGQGRGVAVSADGNTAIVGGPVDDGQMGAAWVFTRNNGVWSQQGSKLVGAGPRLTVCPDGESLPAAQGGSVALSADGNTAIVGGELCFGAAWVYTRSSGTWSAQAKLVGSDAVGVTVLGPASALGVSVSLSGDGNTAILGNGADDGFVGAAWIFTRSNGVWSQQGPKLVGTGGGVLSADGNTAILGYGADNSGVGGIRVFVRSNGVWGQQGPELVGTGAVGAAHQGTVSLCADGNTAIVGGFRDNSGVGAAWMFMRTKGVWSQLGPKLVGTGAIGAAWQGLSVALSADGNTAIVGGPSDDNQAGAVWVWIRTIAGVISEVGGLSTLNSGEQNGLTSKLQAAEASLARGNSIAAINQLNAFINQVRALQQSGRLEPATANSLISAVKEIISSIQ